MHHTPYCRSRSTSICGTPPPGQGVRPLAARRRKFPWARWHCAPCDLHFEVRGSGPTRVVEPDKSGLLTVSTRGVGWTSGCNGGSQDLARVGGHLASPRHAGAARVRALDTTLQLLPLPSPPHLAGIAALLATLDREETLTPGDLAAREEVRRLLEELIAPEVEQSESPVSSTEGQEPRQITLPRLCAPVRLLHVRVRAAGRRRGPGPLPGEGGARPQAPPGPAGRGQGRPAERPLHVSSTPVIDISAPL